MKNNGIEGELRNENSNTIKQSKRKTKQDFKTNKDLCEPNAQKQEASEEKVAGIDIDSMMKKTTSQLPIEQQRRAHKRTLQQRLKKRSPVKQHTFKRRNTNMGRPESSMLAATSQNDLHLNMEEIKDSACEMKRLAASSLSPLNQKHPCKATQLEESFHL